MVDDKPFLEPLHDILEIRYDILMVLLDQRKALLRSYKGSEIRREKRIKSYVGSKHKKGGWSQRRFSRIREIQIKKHFDSIAGSLRKFDVDGKELILVGGPSKAKKEFVREHLSSEIKNKTRIVQLNFSSTEEQTSRVLINQLDSFRKDVELKLLSGVEESIKRKLVVKENREILKALEVGAVEKLLVASDYYAATPGENELILRLIELAEQTSAEIEFITQQDVLKELHHHGSVIAILRYRLI
jgi:peptide subunit release factor 1 (eRF1)